MGSRQLSTICESIEAVLINTIQVRQNNYTNIADFYLYMCLKVVQFKTFFTWNQMKIWMCTSIRRKFLMFHFLQCVEMGKKLRFLRKVERATFFPSNHRFDLKRSVEFTENLDGKVVKNALTVLRKIQHFSRQINVFTKELLNCWFHGNLRARDRVL